MNISVIDNFVKNVVLITIVLCVYPETVALCLSRNGEKKVGIKMTARMGKGLIANQNIRQGEYIAPYQGELLTKRPKINIFTVCIVELTDIALHNFLSPTCCSHKPEKFGI